MSQPKVSIVVPVYNVEPYIERCLRSLFEQTLDSLEYIFIDDCGKDGSIDILERVLTDYPTRQPQTKIIRHETNHGVGQSRQDGVDAAAGEYIIHCDPDDWVELDLYEKLYNKAKYTDADIVICPYYEEDDTTSILRHTVEYVSKRDMFGSIVRNRFHMGLWNKLVKRELARSFRIPIGVNRWEDMSIMVPVLMSSKIIVFINDSAYHYRINNVNSIMHQVSHKNVRSQIAAVKSIRNWLTISSMISQIDEKDLWLFEWLSKRYLLLNCSQETCNEWKSTFPDATYNYLKLDIPIKSKVLSCLAIHGFHRIINLMGK